MRPVGNIQQSLRPVLYGEIVSRPTARVTPGSVPAWRVRETFGDFLSYTVRPLYIVVTKGPTVFVKLLPQPIDNSYRGYKAALWLFGLVVGVRIAQSLAVIFNGYNTAINADGIPVDTYSPEAARQIVAVFAQGSLWRLTLGLLCVLVLVRYRSAVPLMFVLLLLNYLASQLVFQFIPLTRAGTPPGPYVNFGLFALTIVGLMLSLPSRNIRT
jgi:hypothetical protein